MLNKNKNVPQREVHLTLATSEEVVVPFWSSQRAMVRFVISENGFKRFGCSLRNKRRIVRAPVESAGHRGGHTLNPESQMSHGSSVVRVCPPPKRPTPHGHYPHHEKTNLSATRTVFCRSSCSMQNWESKPCNCNCAHRGGEISDSI